MAGRKITRRQLIVAGGVAVGGACLACAGLGYAATKSIGNTSDVAVDTPEFHYGESADRKNSILVVYATRTGSTVGVAAAIGEVLGGRGFSVDVRPAKGDPSTEGYQSFVIGSAVNGGQWLTEAAEYVSNHQAELSRAPTAFFCVHIMNLGDSEGARKKRLAYLDPIRAMVPPADEAFFSGKGTDPQKDSALMRWLAKTFVAIPEGDHRDWTAIRGWGEGLFV